MTSLKSALAAILLLALPGVVSTPAECSELAPPLEISSVSTNGDWRPMAPITPRAEHDGVYDPVRRRLIVFAGSGETTFNDVWELNLDGPPAWRLIIPAGTPPSPRFGATTIYDPLRDRIVVFGGWGTSNLADTWELTLSGTPTWNEVVTTWRPPARSAHTAVYDPVRDRMLIHGGTDGSQPLRDTWALSLSGSPAWTKIEADGFRPPLQLHSAIYDALRNRMIVFGGYDIGVRSETWALDFSPWPHSGEWIAITGSGTAPALMSHMATYDPVADRMVVFGGSSWSTPPLQPMSKIWSLSLGSSPAWSSQTSSGGPPTDRDAGVAVYDPVTARVIVVGGSNLDPMNTIWSLDIAGTPSWTPVLAESHPTWPGQRAVLDPARHRIVAVTCQSKVFRYEHGSQTWAEVVVAGVPPPISSHADFCLVHDPIRDRLILFGGVSRGGVWELTLSAPMRWSMVAPSMTPNPRADQTAIYDSERDRILAFGGHDPSSATLHNDVWALSLSGVPTWSPLVTSGPPPGVRRRAAGVYDPINDRFVIHGGDGPMRTTPAGAFWTLGDLWTLNLSAPVPAWVSHIAFSGPAPRTAHTTVFDPARRRMILFGGYDYTLYFVRSAFTFGDVWALDLSGLPAWTTLVPSGRPAMARSSHSAVFDVDRSAMDVFGGEYTQNSVDYTPISDPMTLSFSDGVTAVTVSLVSLEANPDGVRAEWHSASGRTATVSRSSGGESWTLKASLVSVDDGRFVYEDRDVLPGRRYGYRIDIRGDDGTVASSESWIDVPGTVALDLVGLTPNPSTGPLSVAFTLPRSGAATIELLDTSGRRVLQRRAEFAAGRHLLRLAPAGAVAPGIYFVRLSHGTEQRTRRCSVLE